MIVKKILIIEEDIFLIKVIQKSFQKRGYEASTILDQSKTASIATAVNPDAILFNLISPQKKGFEIISDLKKSLKTKHIPIVIISHLSSNRDINKAKKIGVTKYFIKSDISLDAVIKYIESL